MPQDARIDGAKWIGDCPAGFRAEPRENRIRVLAQRCVSIIKRQQEHLPRRHVGTPARCILLERQCLPSSLRQRGHLPRKKRPAPPSNAQLERAADAMVAENGRLTPHGPPPVNRSPSRTILIWLGSPPANSTQAITPGFRGCGDGIQRSFVVTPRLSWEKRRYSRRCPSQYTLSL